MVTQYLLTGYWQSLFLLTTVQELSDSVHPPLHFFFVQISLNQVSRFCLVLYMQVYVCVLLNFFCTFDLKVLDLGKEYSLESEGILGSPNFFKVMS